MNDTIQITPPILRRLWLVITLTCLIFTFPIALLILLTGKVYRWRDTGWAPISDKARWIYAGALGFWLLAAIANFAISGKSGQETWKENQVVTSQSRSEAQSGDANAETPAMPEGDANFTGGSYHRTSPATANMTIERRDGRWRISIDGAGPPAGGNTAANCSLVAEGQLVNDEINADLVPFETDTAEITAEDLKENPGKIVVKVSPSNVTVLRATVIPHCGIGSDLTGLFRLVP